MQTPKAPKFSLVTLFVTLLCFLLSGSTAALADNDWRIVGPTGGDVRDLIVDPTNPDRIYFGTLDGQIYLSSDAGQNWALLHNFNRPQLYVDSILVDKQDSRLIYVGTHKHQAPGGFFKSKDGGLTWNEAPQMRNEAIYSLEQSQKNPDLLVAGTNHGVFRSDDRGETWAALPTDDVLGPDGKPGGLKNVESLALDPADVNIMYAGTWWLPFKTTDGGQTWTVVKKGMIEDSDVFAIEIDDANPKHVIASACSGIYESTDGAANWKKIQGIPSSSRRTRAIIQHPTIKNLILAGTTEGFWRSEDEGKSWMLVTSKTLEINSISVNPERPNYVFIGTNNYGVMVSKDAGKTFVPTNSGYSSRFTKSIIQDIERPNRFYATTINTTTGGGFFFISEDSGATWRASMRNMSGRVISYALLQDAKNKDLIYLGTNNGIYRSIDRGASWSSIGAAKTTSTKPTQVAVQSETGATPAAAPVAASAASRSRTVTTKPKPAAAKKTVAKKAPAKTKTLQPKPIFLQKAVMSLTQTWSADGRMGILAGTDEGLYRTFEPEKGGQLITYGTGLDKRTTYVLTSPTMPNTIWVGTVNSGVLVSRDYGATWQKVAGVPNTTPITVIQQDKRDPARIYVGTKQTLYLSRDGGVSWQRRGGGLPFGEYQTIVINPQNGDEILVGNAFQNELGGALTLNGGGVYRSQDGGNTWERLDSREANLPSQRIWALAFDTHNPGRVLVGSHMAGIYVLERNTGITANTETPR